MTTSQTLTTATALKKAAEQIDPLRFFIQPAIEANPEHPGDCIREDGTVDLEALLSKYENPAEIGELEARRHYVRMTPAQRSVFFTIWYHFRAEPVREKYVKKYKLTDQQAAIDDNIVNLMDYEEDIKPCEGCKGDFCKQSSMYSQPTLIYDGDKIHLKSSVSCRVHQRYLEMLKLKEDFGLAAIPIKYQALNFSDYHRDKDNSDALTLAMMAVIDTSKGLYIYGHCGVGKSMLTAIIANEAVKQGRSTLFASVPRILQTIKSTFDKDTGEDTGGVIRRLESIDLLIFDDFGSERATEWVVEILFSLINERYQNRKQTIFTSNLTLDQIKKRLNGVSEEAGSRIVSRITEMCQVTAIGGEDRRSMQN